MVALRSADRDRLVHQEGGPRRADSPPQQSRVGEHEVIIDRVFAPGASSAAWSRGLTAWVRDGHPGRVLKHDATTLVVAAQLAGRAVVVKRWSLEGMSRLKAMLGAGRGQRHWAGAAWLARHKIATAPCLVLAHDGAAGVRRDYLVMDRLHGPSVLELLARAREPDAAQPRPRTRGGGGGAGAGVRDELAIARQLGRQIAHMIAHGRFNRDHKPSNLMIVPAADGPGVAVIDCVAILPLSRGGGAGTALERMLASLYIEPLGVGVPPRRSLVLAALCAALGLEHRALGSRAPGHPPGRRLVRGLWLSIAARVRAHGDAAPKVNPLV